MSPSRLFAIRLVFVAFLASSSHAWSDTFVLPHLLETSGGIGTGAVGFDTNLYFSTAGGLACEPADDFIVVWTFLLDGAGNPILGADGTEVANPHVFDLPQGHAYALRFQDLFMAAGGFPADEVTGMVIIDAESSDGLPLDGRLGIQGERVHGGTVPGDISVFMFQPQPIAATASDPPPGSVCRTFVIPRFLESSGTIEYPGQFDTEIHVSYSRGLPGIDGPSASTDFDVFMFGEVPGEIFKGASGEDICNPCELTLDASLRQGTFSLQNLIEAEEFPAGVVIGYAIITVTGDTDAANVTTFVTNSHSSALDLALFGYDPPEVSNSDVMTPVPEQAAALREQLRGYPNPFNPQTQVRFSLGTGQMLQLEIFDASGRKIRTLIDGFRSEGEHRVDWDGLDDAGREMPSGVYFSRLDSEEGTRVGKLTLLR